MLRDHRHHRAYCYIFCNRFRGLTSTFYPFNSGVGIYFLSPLWPYRVNTAISLDSSPASLIELVDNSRPGTGQGPETAPFRVVWSATGLANTQHTLQISVGVGQSFAIVDGLMYAGFINAPCILLMLTVTQLYRSIGIELSLYASFHISKKPYWP